jgi:hypothetical protein
VNPHLIAYSVDHDGPCEVGRSVTFHEAAGEAHPAFTRYKLTWTDAIGCRHIVRYDLVLVEDAAEQQPSKYVNRDNHYSVHAA